MIWICPSQAFQIYKKATWTQCTKQVWVQQHMGKPPLHRPITTTGFQTLDPLQSLCAAKEEEETWEAVRQAS